MTVTAVQSHSSWVSLTSKLPSHTDIKVQKIALYTLAAVLLSLGARLAFAVSVLTPSAALTAAACFAIGIGVAYHAYSLINYQDAAVLAQLRKEALETPLTQTVKKHRGWRNLLLHQILTQDAFQIAYRKHVKSFSFPKILAFYHEMSALKSPFEVPSPKEWEERFTADTKDLRCEQLLDQYSLTDLRSFELLSEEKLEILSKVKAARAHFYSTEQTLNQEFNQRTRLERQNLNRSKQIADSLRFQRHCHDSYPSRCFSTPDTASANFLMRQAQNKFDIETFAVRKEINEKLATNLTKYKAAITSFEQAYTDS